MYQKATQSSGKQVLCCCSSGAGGGANKGPAVVDKRNQVLECPHCEREFKQVQRYREHIAKKHPEEQATGSAESAAGPALSASKVHMTLQLAQLLTMRCCFALSWPSSGLRLLELIQRGRFCLQQYMSKHEITHVLTVLAFICSMLSLQNGSTLQPGSRGGYFTEKSPKMLLLEWCQQQKRQKPRYQVIAAGAIGLRCKVILAVYWSVA